MWTQNLYDLFRLLWTKYWNFTLILPEIPDKIRRFVHMRQRREEVTCPNIDTVIIVAYENTGGLKTSLTFKCLIEHLLADFSYSRPLDTYLWKQMMKMNRNITYKWCNIAKKHLLFTKRKCHKFSWLFTWLFNHWALVFSKKDSFLENHTRK